MKRILTLLAAGLCVFGAQAQSEVMLIDADARNLGMGGVAMTNLSGSHALFTNSAASGFSRQKMQLSFSYLSPSDANYYNVSGFYNFDSRNIIQGGWRRYSNESLSNDMCYTLGYTRRIGERWSFGAVLNYFRRSEWDAKFDNGLSADFSFMYIRPLDFGSYTTFRLGGKVGNLGFSFDRPGNLPIQTSVGAALDSFVSDAHEVTLGLDLGYYIKEGRKNNDNFYLSLGAEYNLMQLFQLRAGYHFSQAGNYIPSYGSVGAGVRFLHVRLDFAYLFAQNHSPFYKTWSISFGMDF